MVPEHLRSIFDVLYTMGLVGMYTCNSHTKYTWKHNVCINHVEGSETIKSVCSVCLSTAAVKCVSQQVEILQRIDHKIHLRNSREGCNRPVNTQFLQRTLLFEFRGRVTAQYLSDIAVSSLELTCRLFVQHKPVPLKFWDEKISQHVVWIRLITIT